MVYLRREVMMNLKRRGFVGWLAAFFGVRAAGVGTQAATESVGETISVATLEVGCQIGDIIEIECDGATCLAVVDGVPVAMSAPSQRGSRGDFLMGRIPGGSPDIVASMET
jgi:hypothetical protein